MGGKSNTITITDEKGRLSKEDIERMVKEAEEFKEADEAPRKKVDARNELDRYDLKDKFTEEERSNLQSAADDVIKWLDEQKEAGADEYESKQKELEGVVNPVMVRVYSQVAEEGKQPSDSDSQTSDSKFSEG